MSNLRHQPFITRAEILKLLNKTLTSLDYVQAMWEGGAAAFHRIDDWSDLDIYVVADDERVTDVFRVIERALSRLTPITLAYEVPQPTWHGHAQKFYRLSGASEFLLLDLVVMRQSQPNKYLQPEIHGQVVVHFDKAEVTQIRPLDRAALLGNIQAHLANLQVTFELFQILILKELNRHNDIEALTFYHSFTLRPLVTLLRIKYQPARYQFHTRYLYYDLPPEVIAKLEPLFFVTSGADLRVKRAAAEQLFYRTLAQLDPALLVPLP